MKKVFIVCLLGIGLLLPNNQIAARNSSITKTHFKAGPDVSIFIEDDALLANSSPSAGTITRIRIFNQQNVKVLDQPIAPSFTTALDISDLPVGVYTIKVSTTNTLYTEVTYM